MKRIRVRTRRFVPQLCLAALLLGACGTGGPVAVERVETPENGREHPDVSNGTRKADEKGPRNAGSGGHVALEVWFQRSGLLFPTTRMRGYTQAVGSAAVEELLAGPTVEETAGAGLGTSIPASTQLLDLDISEGIATVDLSSHYESGGGSSSMFMRLAQVVYTLTQFPTVQGVNFRIDGRPVEVFSSEGIVLDHPVTRKDYEDLLAPIVVLEPYAGQRVSSPLTVAGTANVFEATVTMRILDADGTEIAHRFTTATCGTGCRGTYQAKMSFDVKVEQKGTVEVYEESAEDGSPIHIVSIPVTLLP